MTVLLNGNVSIPAGVRMTNPVAVPAGIKQPGVPLTLKISMGAEQFPNGTTTITVFISTNNGSTYRSASMQVEMPHTFKGAAPHFWVLTYSVGADEVPTHAKYATDAPSAFTTAVTLEAL